MDNLFGLGDAVDADFWIFAQVDHGLRRKSAKLFWLWTATARKMGPSHRNRLPNVASQMRVAFANIALKTGSNSPGELEMTFRLPMWQSAAAALRQLAVRFCSLRTAARSQSQSPPDRRTS